MLKIGGVKMHVFAGKEKLLIKYVQELDEENVVKLADEILNEGTTPPYVLELINRGMYKVGELYENKDYYIADLIMAGLIFRKVLELDKMTAHFQNNQTKKIGKIIIGTVKGDIHDIGKDIFRGMLEINGFEVVDLGVDVPKEIFFNSTIDHKPHIIGLSGVLTNTIETMKEIVAFFAQKGMREQVKFIVGGSHLARDSCAYIGADGFANDASVGVKMCKKWVERTN